MNWWRIERKRQWKRQQLEVARTNENDGHRNTQQCHIPKHTCRAVHNCRTSQGAAWRKGGVAGAVAVAVEGGGERGGWQGQEQGLSPASANKRTGQNCACNQFQVCAARGLFEKAIPLPHSPNLRPVSTSLSSPQSSLPPNRQRRLSSEKYATLSSWTRLCCCCFISPLPCLPSHTAHRDSDAGRFGQLKSR